MVPSRSHSADDEHTSRRAVLASLDLCSLRRGNSDLLNPPTSERRRQSNTDIFRPITNPITMSGSAQQPDGSPNERQEQPESQEDGDEPFNPLTNATHDTNSRIGNSVAKDLMRVYESLTQSSTPQTPPKSQGGRNQKDKSNLHPQQQQQQQQQHDHIMQGYPPLHPQYSQQHPMSYYHFPPAQHPPPPNHYYPEHHQCQQQQGPPIPYGMAPPDQQPSYYGMSPQDQQEQEQQVPSSEPTQMDLKEGESSDENENNSDEPQEQRTSRSKQKKRGGSEVDTSVSSKGSVGKKRKKSNAPRFTWPEDLHRDFVSAIFDVGLKHSSPSTILEHMSENDQITVGRIKSHLQKYRMHRAKSKKEFATFYEHSLTKLKASGLNGVKSLSAGEVPAHLAYTAMHDGNSSSPVKSAAPMDEASTSAPAMNEPPKLAPPAPVRQPSDALMLPQLTEAEKASPIGASMGYLMGLLFSLKQQLMVQQSVEERAENDKNNAPDAQRVFNSFAGTHSPPPFAVARDNQVRTNVEENNMMKREMQNQMAFQNKMRALKQQELNKYKNVSSELKEDAKDKVVEDVHASIPTKQDDENCFDTEAAERYQGASEAAGTDPSSGTHARSRSRGMSMGGSDEFWNDNVIDEQLFEFLMNN